MTPQSATNYDTAFFDAIAQGSLSSARAVVPLILKLSGARSVVDVGCGTGTWLTVFLECGITDITGLDGDYVDRSRLIISPDRFQVADLRKPPAVARRYDLALSLEVAEHLPEESAGDFVRFLCSLAPIVVFSAALPGQGGIDHVNEQWPWYWQKRFQKEGMQCIDALRPQLWNRRDVEFWYRQNLLVFANAEALARLPELSALAERDRLEVPLIPLSGELIRRHLDQPSLRTVLRQLPGAAWRAVRRRFPARKSP